MGTLSSIRLLPLVERWLIWKSSPKCKVAFYITIKASSYRDKRALCDIILYHACVKWRSRKSSGGACRHFPRVQRVHASFCSLVLVCLHVHAPAHMAHICVLCASVRSLEVSPPYYLSPAAASTRLVPLGLMYAYWAATGKDRRADL